MGVRDVGVAEQSKNERERNGIGFKMGACALSFLECFPWQRPLILPPRGPESVWCVTLQGFLGGELPGTHSPPSQHPASVQPFDALRGSWPNA